MSKKKRYHHLAELLHLLDQLGEERFSALIDSANTGKLKILCEQLLMEGPLPGRMKIGKHTYTIIDPLLEDEKAENVRFFEMLRRVKGANEFFSDRGAKCLLENQQDIPIACRGDKVIFIFLLSDIDVNDSEFYCCRVFWHDIEKVWWGESLRLSKWDSRYRIINKIWTCD